MKDELTLRKRLLDFLTIEKQYSNESIIQEYLLIDNNLNRRYRADFVIVDIESNGVIGLIEFKKEINDKTKNDALFQVTKYSQLINRRSLPIYLIGLENGELTFYSLDSMNKWSNIDKDIFPNYKALQANSTEIKKIQIEQQKKRNIDTFTVVSIILAVIVLVVLILKQKGCLKVDSNDMVLLGLFVFLAIIPFAAKLKLPGLEFERKK